MDSRKLSVSIHLLAFVNLLIFVRAGNFLQDTNILYGDGRAKILEGGQLFTLTMDKASGAGFVSKNEYLFGRFDMRVKLPPGNTAGTVATFYLSSQGPNHDEIDFEFLGNQTRSPYTVHTNVILQGTSGREQEFYLWFDPTKDFHLYTIVWNPQRIILMVDNVPIRVYTNWGLRGTRYATNQPMKMYATFWNADDWATQGGRVKTDWSQAPFTVSYRDYNADGCVPPATFPCPSKPTGPHSWQYQQLGPRGRNMLRWVQQKFMIYNYCTDVGRYRGRLPSECRKSRFL